jgi:hypothetical protein
MERHPAPAGTSGIPGVVDQGARRATQEDTGVRAGARGNVENVGHVLCKPAEVSADRGKAVLGRLVGVAA